MEVNEYLRMRNSIKTMVTDYEEILQKCQTNNKWHSESIRRLSRPFINSPFTLAIVGEMSSGKSTFINTLIGNEILPTGHFQTTSAITYIEHDTKEHIQVVYADGKIRDISGSDMKSELINLIALPKDYKDLPINDINTLIIEGEDVEVILKQKSGIEDKTHSMVCNEGLWRDYIKSHPVESIAKKVHIYVPLSEEMQGWRIVDTPGVNSIGGIQDETKKLFASRDTDCNKVVDAIIFLQRGDDNMQSESNVVFVGNTIKGLTEEAKQRLFFVLTHAAARKFLQEKDEIIKEAQGIYSETFNIPKERITYVDSLLARFHDDVISKGIDVSAIDPSDADPIEGWTEKACDEIYTLFTPLKKELKKRNLNRNNPNLLALMEEWGNFVALKRIINDFVRDVKESSYQKIIKYIVSDYELMVKSYQEEISILEGGKKSIEQERKTNESKRVEYNKILNRFRHLAAKDPILEKFKFIDVELYSLTQKKSIEEVRKAYQDLADKVTLCERQIFEGLSEEFKAYCRDYDKNDFVIGSIDIDEIRFNSLENDAEAISKKNMDIYKTEEYKEGFICPEKKTREVYVRTDYVTDHDKKLREFTAYVLTIARSLVQKFERQLEDKVVNLCEKVEIAINVKLDDFSHRLNELESNLFNKENEIQQLNEYISIIEAGIKKHNNHEYE